MIGAPEETGFAVLTSPRSGSTWLIDLINRTTQAQVFAELFIPQRKPGPERRMTAETSKYLDANFRGYPLFCEARRRVLDVRPARTFTYLNRLYGRHGATGFKLMYSNILHLPEIWVYLVWRRIRVVHLVRLNHLDVYISSQVRFATGTVHSLVGEAETPGVQIELNITDLFRSMQRSRRNIQMARRLLHLSPIPHLEVHYEDLLLGSSALVKLCDFLQLPLQRPSAGSNLRKLVTESHSKVVKNYADVRKALRGTDFEGLLQ
jgi:LPS sulfotransferase NodH